ncbi:17140_t:CDS:1, partial [Dentiscutata heterogama]
MKRSRQSKSSITVHTKVEENPSEFRIENNILFCNFCDHLKSTIDYHLK